MFMGPTWGPPGSCRPQMGPMLAPCTLLSGISRAIIDSKGLIRISIFSCSGVNKACHWYTCMLEICLYELAWCRSYVHGYSDTIIIPLLSYFSVVVCMRCLLHHTLIAHTFRENLEFVFIIIMQYMMSANSWIRLFVHYTISLSSLCKLIWRHWIYKMPVRYILSSVWARLSIFSQLSIIQYVGLCVFSLPISPVMIESIIIKSEVRTITHCLGLGHETTACAVCLSIFLW